MKRKDFIKKALLTSIFSAVAPQAFKATNNIASTSTDETVMEK